MRVERSTYNQSPELNGRVNISHWAFGERSRVVLERNLSRRGARSKFTTTPDTLDSPFITLFFPGTVGKAETVFEKQIPQVEKGSGVVLLDYSDSDFYLPLLRAQVMDFLDSSLVSGKKVRMIGMSLGAANIMDVLFNENEAQERVDMIVLLGTVFSFHDLNLKGKMRMLAKLYSVAPDMIRAGLSPVAVRGVPFAQRIVGIEGDPMMGDGLEVVRGVSPRAFLRRVDSVLRREKIEKYVERLGHISTPSTLIRWENDESDPQRHEVITQAFQKVTVAHIPGSHGWTHTNADYINPLLSPLPS